MVLIFLLLISSMTLRCATEDLRLPPYLQGKLVKLVTELEKRAPEVKRTVPEFTTIAAVAKGNVSLKEARTSLKALATALKLASALKRGESDDLVKLHDYADFLEENELDTGSITLDPTVKKIIIKIKDMHPSGKLPQPFNKLYKAISKGKGELIDFDILQDGIDAALDILEEDETEEITSKGLKDDDKVLEDIIEKVDSYLCALEMHELIPD